MTPVEKRGLSFHFSASDVRVVRAKAQNTGHRVPPVGNSDACYAGSLIPRTRPTKNEEGRPIGPPFKNWKRATGYYLPAPAAAAAGIIPAIFMPSIRVSTASRLAPVSVQAST